MLSYLFVSEHGDPRKSVTYLIKQCQLKYLPRAVAPHSFRHRQGRLRHICYLLTQPVCVAVIDSLANGATPVEHEALSKGRQHTVAVADQYYAIRNKLKDAETASRFLEKRKRVIDLEVAAAEASGDGIGLGFGEDPNDQLLPRQPKKKRARLEESAHDASTENSRRVDEAGVSGASSMAAGG